VLFVKKKIKGDDILSSFVVYPDCNSPWGAVLRDTLSYVGIEVS
jgi:hypothetical protein